MDIYEEVGVRKAINAWGHITKRGGSKMPPEVLEAMLQAAKHFVLIDDFKAAVGREIAKLTHNEACEPCCGAAAGVLLSTAACVAGTDPVAHAQLPHLEGLKNEVVVFRAQANPYWSVVQRVGVRIREVGLIRGTQPWELEAALGPQTAAVFFFTADFYNRGASLTLEETVEIAHKAGVPVVVDAACQLPPVENLWRFTQAGADLAIFSGGKAICGPQASGFIVGRKDLIEACRLANTPNHNIGRPMKVGKEELAGLYAAVKRYVNLDHAAWDKRWESQVAYMVEQLQGIKGVDARRDWPGESGIAIPRVRIAIDEAELGRTMGQVLESLHSGDPWIAVGPEISLAGQAVSPKAKGFFVNPHMLDEGEERIVAARLRQAFGVA